MRVFVTRSLPASLSALEEIAAVEVWPERQPPPYSALQEKIRSCNGLLCLLTDPVDGALIEAAPQLKVISQMAVGYDNIDVAAATARGIPVGHTPGVLTEATADLTWALLMVAARQVVAGDRYVRQGRWTTWEPDLLLGPDVFGATLGIVGLGRIGQAVARRAQGFNMRVLYTAPQPVAPELEATLGVHYADLDRLLQEADFVTLHTPLTPAANEIQRYVDQYGSRPNCGSTRPLRGSKQRGDCRSCLGCVRSGTDGGRRCTAGVAQPDCDASHR